MKNFILGAICCYVLFNVPKAQAGIPSDIEAIVEILNKISTSVQNIELNLKHCTKR
jgi:hypothetical protein